MSTLSQARSFVPAGSQLNAELRSLLRGLQYNIAARDAIVAFIDAHGTATGSAVEAEDLADVNGLLARHFAHVEYESAEDWPALFDEGQWVTSDAVDATAESTDVSLETSVLSWIKSDSVDAPADAEIKGDNVTFDSDFDADTLPACGAPPAEAYLGRDLEPSASDRAWWAMTSAAEARLDNALDMMEREGRALELLTAGLLYSPAPICPGPPSPEPRWDDADGTRARPQRNIRDEDVIVSTGCCG